VCVCVCVCVFSVFVWANWFIQYVVRPSA